MNNFNDEAAYKAYFESIATSHNDLSTFIFGDEKVMTEAQRSSMGSGYTLWLDYYPPIRPAGSMDNQLGIITAEWVVMTPISSRNQTTDQAQIALKACEDICQQIFAKIMNDFDLGLIDNQNEPQYSSLQMGRMESHQFGSTTYSGTAAQIDFHVPLKMIYDQTKWS